MFVNGLLFGLGWFIAKNIFQITIPEFVHIFTSGCYTDLCKKYKTGEIKTVSEAINYIHNYVPNKTKKQTRK